MLGCIYSYHDYIKVIAHCQIYKKYIIIWTNIKPLYNEGLTPQDVEKHHNMAQPELPLTVLIEHLKSKHIF